MMENKNILMNDFDGDMYPEEERSFWQNKTIGAQTIRIFILFSKFNEFIELIDCMKKLVTVSTDCFKEQNPKFKPKH